MQCDMTGDDSVAHQPLDQRHTGGELSATLWWFEVQKKSNRFEHSFCSFSSRDPPQTRCCYACHAPKSVAGAPPSNFFVACVTTDVRHGSRESGVGRLGTRESGLRVLGSRDSGVGTRELGVGTRESGLGSRESGLGSRDSGPVTGVSRPVKVRRTS
jgi:hypothetical protein